MNANIDEDCTLTEGAATSRRTLLGGMLGTDCTCCRWPYFWGEIQRKARSQPALNQPVIPPPAQTLSLKPTDNIISKTT